MTCPTTTAPAETPCRFVVTTNVCGRRSELRSATLPQTIVFGRPNDYGPEVSNPAYPSL